MANRREEDPQLEESLEAQGSEPRPVEALADAGCIVAVAAGDSCSFALTREGATYSWGHGASGHGAEDGDTWFPAYALPTLVASLSHLRVVAIATSSFGPGHTLALTADGMVYAFGAGDNGVLGVGSEDNIMDPTLIESFVDEAVVIRAFGAGSGHSVALSADGNLFGWGTGGGGDECLGLQLEGDQLIPKRYPDLCASVPVN